MKDIMSSNGIVDVDGVPRFEFSREGSHGMQLQFLTDRPFAVLKEELLQQFKGRTRTVRGRK